MAGGCVCVCGGGGVRGVPHKHTHFFFLSFLFSCGV